MRSTILRKADKNTEAGALPDQKLLAPTGKNSEGRVKAGVTLTGEGLQAGAQGARVTFSAAKPQVIDGPLADFRWL